MMLAASDHVDETKVRALRDRVFESISTDKNWEACKRFWMKPQEIQWLVQHDPNPNLTAN